MDILEMRRKLKNEELKLNEKSALDIYEKALTYCKKKCPFNVTTTHTTCLIYRDKPNCIWWIKNLCIEFFKKKGMLKEAEEIYRKVWVE